jgi:hypothetical protein
MATTTPFAPAASATTSGAATTIGFAMRTISLASRLPYTSGSVARYVPSGAEPKPWLRLLDGRHAHRIMHGQACAHTLDWPHQLFEHSCRREESAEPTRDGFAKPAWLISRSARGVSVLAADGEVLE